MTPSSSLLNRYVRRELRGRELNLIGPVVCHWDGEGCGATVFYVEEILEHKWSCPLCGMKVRTTTLPLETVSLTSTKTVACMIVQLAADACPDCGESTEVFDCRCTRMARLEPVA